FFFQAEDGIRYFHVTGVQTCALPIYVPGSPLEELKEGSAARWFATIPPCEWPTIITFAPGGMPAASIAARTSSIAAGCCPATRRRFEPQSREFPCPP